jgi:hypothetical protein
MGWDWVNLLRRPINGLLYQTRMIGDESVECKLAGETEVLGENLLQRHLVHKSHKIWPGLEPEPPRWEADD